MTKTTIYKQFTSLVFGACVMSMLASCGGGVKSGAGETGERPRNTNPIVEDVPEELGLVGRYVVEFDSMNSQTGGNIASEAMLQVMGDQIVVHLDVKDSLPNTAHSQFIYSGTECPSVHTHDTNADGYIDPIEASAVIGDILVPLDTNIDGQELGQNEFEAANMFGRYNYKIEGVLSALLADLHAPDLNPNDEVAKLKANEKFKLEGKVIVVQGVAQTEWLPGSIRTHEGTSDRGSLIKACGKIKRVIFNGTTPVVPGE